MSKVVNFNHVTLEQGDCIYVPAYYFVQTKTVDDDNYEPEYNGKNAQTVLISHWYESHSALVDMVFDGIEDNNWTDYKVNKYDRMFNNWLSDFL